MPKEILNDNPKIEIWLGDCLTLMRDIKDKSIDLVLTDPPYGVGADKGVGGGIQKGRKYNGNWDIKPERIYFEEMLRISKQMISFGGNFFTDMLPCNGHWIVWDKTGEIKFDNPYSKAELAWTNIKKNTVEKYTVIQAGFIALEKDRWHPTQKPVALLKAIIRDYTENQNTILDPFMGSGTTLIAAKELGRNAIGIEIEPKYYNVARQRILNTQKSMF